MTLYLTDNLPPDEIARAKDAGVVAVKLYPAGATTNSDAGVTDMRKTYQTLEAMQRDGLLLLVHGEVTAPEIDLFDREAVFIERAADSAAPRLPRAEDRVRAHHHEGSRAVRARRRTASPAPPSPRTTCCTTATRSSPAASARTTTACRCSSAKRTAWRWWRRPPAAAPSSSSAPTARRTRRTSRSTPAAAPAATPRTRRSSCMPKPSTAPARSTSSKASPASTAPDFYGLPRNTDTITLRRESVDAARELALRRGAAQAAALGRSVAVAHGLVSAGPPKES